MLIAQSRGDLLEADRMRAALLVEPGEIVIDEIPEPMLGPDDVRSPSVESVCAART